MVDIVMLSLFIWGTVFLDKIPLNIILGDIIAVIFVIVVYNLLGALIIDKIILEFITNYKSNLIELYLWLEPLQNVELANTNSIIIIQEIISYVFLLLLLFAFILISRNVIGAFGSGIVTTKYSNYVFGLIRNILIVTIVIKLLPNAIIETHIFHKMTQESILKLLFLK